MQLMNGFIYRIYPVFGQTGLSKTCRPSSATEERCGWSASAVFATHPAVFKHINELICKMDLFKAYDKYN